MNVKKMILEGEGLRLDFKKAITSHHKIARTLTAFANTRGGRLLVGVEDNGEIAGVQSEEETYMLETAGSSYCDPPIRPQFEEVPVDNRIVLVAKIPESTSKPHFALDRDGKWWAYIRVEDRSVLSSAIRVEVMKKEKKKENILLEFTDRESRIMNHLQEHGEVNFRGYCQLAGLNRKKASRLLVKMILTGLIRMRTTENNEYYFTGDLPVKQ